jgi:hypothetical protein
MSMASTVMDEANMSYADEYDGWGQMSLFAHPQDYEQ